MRGDVVVENIAFMENLANPFTKTLSTTFFDGHRDSIGVKCIPIML